MKNKIQAELEKIRPTLQMDGGDVEFVNFDEASGKLQVRLLGRCAHCPMSQVTLKQGIEATICENISEVKSVEAV